jgi:hypothetical protein
LDCGPLGDQEAGGAVRVDRHAGRARGQGLFALVVVLVCVAGGVALDRELGPLEPAAAAPGTAPSGGWLCPHGGGPSRWKASVYLGNPGDSPVTARLTSLSGRRPKPPTTVTVPPSADLRVEVPAKGREASTYVEFFGGWVAAGWVAQGGGGEIGVAAEPCAPAAARRWYAPDGTTEQGQDAYLVVMNPFGATAVFDVVLLTRTRAPIRDSALTDIVLPAHRSRAFRLNPQALGEAALGALVEVTVGRVALASLGIGREGGIRSVVGVTSVSDRLFLPAGATAGQSVLAMTNPNEEQVRFGATLLSGEPPHPAGGLTEAGQNGTSAATYPVATEGPSSIDVVTQGSVGVAAAQRARGVGNDSAATGGAVAPAASWIVLPATAGEPSKPGLILVNPGSAPATVTLHALVPEGSSAPPDVTVGAPAGSAVRAPVEFLDAELGAAILVRAEGGSVIAMAASTSLGVQGLSTYALSMGVPVPEGIV